MMTSHTKSTVEIAGTRSPTMGAWTHLAFLAVAINFVACLVAARAMQPEVAITTAATIAFGRVQGERATEPMPTLAPLRLGGPPAR